jgi:hypothetical protein
VTHRTVNSPLPEDALDFSFPEGLLIQYRGNSSKNERVELMGPHGTSIAVIEGPSDLAKAAGFETQIAGSKSTLRIWLIIGNVLVLLLVLAAILRRRQRNMASRQ